VLREHEDGYGLLVLDHLEGRPAQELVERDDGFIMTSKGPLAYFIPVRRWPRVERRALRWVRTFIEDDGS
jgi:hypothetical protein